MKKLVMSVLAAATLAGAIAPTIAAAYDRGDKHYFLYTNEGPGSTKWSQTHSNDYTDGHFFDLSSCMDAAKGVLNQSKGWRSSKIEKEGKGRGLAYDNDDKANYKFTVKRYVWSKASWRNAGEAVCSQRDTNNHIDEILDLDYKNYRDANREHNS